MKFFETKFVVPLVPSSIMPMRHIAYRSDGRVFFAENVGRCTKGTSGWNMRKKRSSAMSRISAGGKLGKRFEAEPVVAGEAAPFLGD